MGETFKKSFLQGFFPSNIFSIQHISALPALLLPTIVTGFAKRGLPHTSSFLTFEGPQLGVKIMIQA